MAAALGTHGDVTVSVVTGGDDGNVSGHWYKPLNSAIDGTGGTYLQVSSTKQIEKISVFYCPNGTKNTNLAWVAWGEDVTPSAEVGSNYGTTTGTTGSKSWDAAVWEDIDLSENSAYTVRISRQIKNLTNGGNKIANTGANQTVNLLGFKVWLKPSGPTITAQPISAAYVTGYAATALHVTATASAGELSYQWYRCDDINKTNPSAISGTSASYTPSTDNAGTFYYYCVVSDSNGPTESSVATITVSAASAPTISISGAPIGDIVTGTEVTLTATATGVPTPTIQWYSNTTASTAGATVISGETSETYSPSTDTPGTKYYFAVGHNTEGDNPSNILAIVVKDKVATPTFTPNGAYFTGESQSVTIACGTDDATIQYSTDGGSNWTNYTEAFNVTETTTIKAKATKDGCIDSDEASATFTKFDKSELVAISSEKTWTIPTSLTLELKDNGTTAPAKYDEYYTYSDIATINGNDLGTFDGTTLAFSGQYPYRGSYGSQNGNLQFKTTVPGSVTVEFSNTGGSNKERWVKVNEITGTVEADGTTKRNETFGVGAGTVTISHVNSEGELSAGLRIYSITFAPVASVSGTITPAGWASFSSSYPLDLSTISGGTAYYASASDGSSVTLTETTAKVPANTGLMIKGEPNAEFTIATTSDETTAIDGNLLKATDGTEIAASPASGAGTYHYVFGYKKPAEEVTEYGFYNLAAATTVPAGKAYLEITSNGARALRISLGGITEVENVEASPVATVKKNGAYLENGKIAIYKNGMKFNANGQLIK